MRPNVALTFPFFAGVAVARAGTRGRKGVLAPLWVSVGGVPRLGPPGGLRSRAGGAGAALGRAGHFQEFLGHPNSYIWTTSTHHRTRAAAVATSKAT